MCIMLRANTFPTEDRTNAGTVRHSTLSGTHFLQKIGQMLAFFFTTGMPVTYGNLTVTFRGGDRSRARGRAQKRNVLVDVSG
jgi:hypothetical protein